MTEQVVAHIDPTGGEASWVRSDIEGVVARVLHRYRHPSFDMGQDRCRCVPDAIEATGLWIKEGRP